MVVNRKILPIVLELIGIAAIGVGIGIEVTMHAEAGFVAITVGSVFIAIGGVIWGKFMKRG